MFCPNCGTKLEDDAVFCVNCGMSLIEERKAAGLDTAPPAPSYHERPEEPVIYEDDRKKGSGKGMVIGLLIAVILLGAAIIGGILLLERGGSSSPASAASAAETQPASSGAEGQNADNGNLPTLIPTGSPTDVPTPILSVTAPPPNPTDVPTPIPSGSATPAPTETPTPIPTPTPMVDNAGIHRYELYVSDVTWEQAWQDALNRGGYLARINSREEMESIISLLNAQSSTKIHYYLGGQCDRTTRQYHWINTDGLFFEENVADPSSWYASYWYPGEPSYVDSELFRAGTTVEEYWMNLMCVDGTWYFNDSTNNLAGVYPDWLRGKVGYIVEFE